MNETQHPNFVVIIPTRERLSVLRHTLLCVLRQDYAHLKIVVSDNFSSDGTRDWVQQVNDPRILYVNTGKRVSMSDNWEFALGCAPDGWITFVGDDDGLPIGSLNRVAEIIRESRAEAIRTRFATYDWPGVLGREKSRLLVPVGHGWRKRNCEKWLSRCLSGKASYAELPMIYNGGFVKRSVFEILRQRSGRYFRSCNPDIYSGIAVASVLESYVYVNEALAINGTSSFSTGSSFNSNDRMKNRAPADKFLSENNLPFHHDMVSSGSQPFPKSIQAYIYESYLQSALLRARTSAALDRIMHQRQLALVVDSESPEPEAIRAWSQIFVDQHGLQPLPRGILRLMIRLRNKARRAILKIRTAMGLVILDGEAVPLQTVEDAAIASATIAARRARIHTWPFLVGERLRSLRAQRDR